MRGGSYSIRAEAPPGRWTVAEEAAAEEARQRAGVAALRLLGGKASGRAAVSAAAARLRLRTCDNPPRPLRSASGPLRPYRRRDPHQSPHYLQQSPPAADRRRRSASSRRRLFRSAHRRDHPERHRPLSPPLKRPPRVRPNGPMNRASSTWRPLRPASPAWRSPPPPPPPRRPRRPHSELARQAIVIILGIGFAHHLFKKRKCANARVK